MVITDNVNTSASKSSKSNFILELAEATTLGSLAHFFVCATIINIGDKLTNTMLSKHLSRKFPELEDIIDDFECADNHLMLQALLLEKRMEPLVKASFDSPRYEKVLNGIEKLVTTVITAKENSINKEMATKQLLTLEKFVDAFERGELKKKE